MSTTKKAKKQPVVEYVTRKLMQESIEAERFQNQMYIKDQLAELAKILKQQAEMLSKEQSAQGDCDNPNCPRYPDIKVCKHGLVYTVKQVPVKVTNFM